MKKLLLIGVAVVVIAMVALVIGVRMLIDSGRVRSTIESQASTALGMPVALRAADVSVWPRARVTLSGLTVGEPASLTLETIDVATALGALMSRRIENAELTIADSTIDLPAFFGALGGLTKDSSPPPVDGTPTDAPLTLVSVDTIAFRNVQVRFDGGSATVSLESALSGDRLDIRSFELASAVTSLKATGAIDSLAGRKGKLAIDAESLDLDGMVALLSRIQSPQSAPAAQQAPAAAQTFEMTFDVTAAKGRAAGVQFDNLETAIHATAAAVRLEPFAFGAFGGRVEGKARVDTSQAEPMLVLSTKFSQLDVGALAAFAGQPNAITGRLAGDLNVSGAGTEPTVALANAKGSGTLAITDGAIPNLHLVRTIVLAFGKPAPESTGGGDRFTHIGATMELAKSVLRFSTLSFASPDVDVDGSGTLDLSAQSINVTGRARLSEGLTAQAGRDLVRFTADGNRVTVPVTVAGGIDAPQVRVDAGSLLRRAAENEVKTQIQKRTGGLLDRFKKKPSKRPFVPLISRSATTLFGAQRLIRPDGSGRVTGAGSSATGVDDRAARLIVTPLVGVLVPNLAGLIDNSAHSGPVLLASYSWFIAVAFLTWEGNLRLYLRFQDRTAWLTRPWHRVRLLVGLILLFTIPFTGGALWAWAAATGDPRATWRSIAMAVIAVVAAVTFITHVYETLFLVREWQDDRRRGEHLQRLHAEAELTALRTEVNPHTLFNSLNALSHLVDQRHPRASAFVSALAGSYRYLLRSGSKRLVPLADELELLDQFLSLATIRYSGGLHVTVHADAQDRPRWCIPPVVLPELLENAVKHNDFDTDNPLRIEVRLEGDRLTVSHRTRPRRTDVVSAGVGLANLAQRFRLTTGVAARWAHSDGRFVVTLPLVANHGSDDAQ